MTEMREMRVLSTDGTTELYVRAALPSGKPRGFLQIVHGMAEHIGRYEAFMQEIASSGYLVFAHDQLGHGKTARESDLGFIAARGGADLLVADVAAVRNAVAAEYGGEGEYTLLGHSMGSFIARLAAAEQAPDRLIVMGTGGRNAAAAPGILLAGIIALLRGGRHVSPLMNTLAFGSYNKRFSDEDERESHLWLSTERASRAAYYADPRAGFPFTVSAMRDLIRLQRRSNLGAWYRKLSSTIPVLLVSGDEDPVGSFGRGVREVARRLEASGSRSVTLRLYRGARHEILNDFSRAEVVSDILDFLARPACEG